ncbi:hypothetical protein SLA2020_494920 [Shorea laevis]
MNSAMKAALISSKASCFHLRAAPFHSTPVLERKRRNYWESRSNIYSKRFRNQTKKQTLLRNASAYADFLFQKDFDCPALIVFGFPEWEDEGDEDEPSSSRGPSWFKRQFSAKGSKRDWAGTSGTQTFGQKESSMEELIKYNYYGRSWNRRHRNEETYDSSSESEISESDMVSDRLALGLNASGPLKLEDVKHAYRACALKWHPDRHQGSSKAVAEEKFKLCSAAYQSLCDKLVLN